MGNEIRNSEYTQCRRIHMSSSIVEPIPKAPGPDKMRIMERRYKLNRFSI